MGIDTGSVLIVGLPYKEIADGLDDQRREKLDELGYYDYLGADGDLELEYASPYYDSDGPDRIWGRIVVFSGDYRAREVPADFEAKVAAAKQFFKDKTGLEGRLFVSPHVT